ncbi:hypothetical protein ACN28I_23350 [Archangium gephyra]|uniref:hypothetical protein n=1 Tax=Archangium gephyra TaxID=48 RepID=UPI003B773EC9
MPPISGRSTSNGSVDWIHLPRTTPCSRGALTLTAWRMAFTGFEPAANHRAIPSGAVTRVRAMADPAPGGSPFFTRGDS